MTKVLFVCLGNICRSPAAEGILRHMAEKDPFFHDLVIESCGLGSWHVGSLPDSRMVETLQKRGIVLTSRAKQFSSVAFSTFDWIFGVDKEVMHGLYKLATTLEEKSKVHYLTAFSKSYYNQEIPDPYYQGYGGFEMVCDMIQDACEGFLNHLKQV